MGMMQQMFASFQTTSGAPGPTTDSLFEYVSLLLSVNTVPFSADASTSNLAIVPVSAVRNDVFTPFSTDGNYSNYYPTSSTTTIPANAAFTYGYGDFTIECWVNPTSHPTNVYLVGQSAASDVAPVLCSFSSGAPRFSASFDGSSWAINNTTGSVIPLNVWTHLAWVRSGNKWSIYVNGTEYIIAASSGITPYTSSDPLKFGAAGGSSAYAYQFLGSVSNLRIVKGTAVYTSNFTPSTAPLTAISGTSLLTCQSAIFKDNSTNAFTITRVGNASVKSAIPFTYSNTYGSAYFNGTTAYLFAPSTSLINFTTGDFTVEGWVYLTAYGSILGSTIISINKTSSVNGYAQVVLNITDAGIPTLSCATSSAGWGPVISGPTAVPLNQWAHVAGVRSGNTFTIYVNGISQSSGTSATTLNAQLGQNSIGYLFDNRGASYTGLVNGYVSNARVCSAAVYTSNFTPSTTPLTAITNTTLLTLQNQLPANNVGFIDSSANDYVLTSTGTPIQGTFSPFSTTGWSTYFNGTTDGFTTPSTAGFGTSDFTVEAWIYISSFAIMDIWSNTASSGTTGIHVYVTAAGKLAASTAGATVYTGTTTLPLNTWAHVALTRTGGNIKGWVNGALDTTTSNSTTFSDAQPMTIGMVASIQFFSGYISNLRVVNGTAVYTSAFTPPTAPLTAITNTILLTCQSSRFKDNSANAFTLTPMGAPSAQAASPFNPTAAYSPATNGGSTYFNGTSDYITGVTAPTIAVGSASFTVECWVYPTAFTNAIGTIMCIQGGASTTDLNIWVNTSGTLAVGTLANMSLHTGGNLVKNAWSHIAMSVNSGGTATMYVNGVQDGSTWTTSTVTSTIPRLGTGSTVARYFTGFISSARIVKGVQVYTGAFTPPTAPLTATANTVLLFNSTNAGVIDYSGRNDVSTIGSNTISPSLVKYGTGSLMFNGTTDYIRIRNTPAVDLSVGNWTLEMWVYKTQNNGNSSRLWNPDGDSYDAMVLSLNATGGVAIQATTASGSWNVINTTFGSTLNNSQWYHIAVVRSGTDLYGFFNGAKTVLTTSCPTTLYNSVAANKVIGGQSGVARMLYGSINDFRVTKGVARYTANFTPPTTSLPLY